MKRLYSNVALSLALVAGAGLTLPQAALAKKKEEAPAAPAAPAKPTASAKFFKVAKEVQDLLTAKNFDGALAKIPEAEALVSTPDDSYFLGNFYLNIGLGKEDLAMQRKGVEVMLTSGRVAAADVSRLETAAGGLAAATNDMDGARKHYLAAIAAGADASQTEAMIAETHFGVAYGRLKGNSFDAEGSAEAVAGLGHLRKAVDALLAKGTKPPLSWYERGWQTALLANAPDSMDWIKLTLPQTDKAATWRSSITFVQQANKTISRNASIDLLRLMVTSKSIKNDYSYAELAESLWKAGLPGEVRSVVDSGTAAGDIKVGRFDELTKLADGAIPKDKAGLAASEVSAMKAATGKPANGTADAYLSYGQYDKAVPLYRKALELGGVDADEVNTRMGIALARKGDFADAKAAFAAVGNAAGVRRVIADLWTIWVERQAQPKPAA